MPKMPTGAVWMKCPNCGQNTKLVIREDGLYCSNCGQKLLPPHK